MTFDYALQLLRWHQFMRRANWRTNLGWSPGSDKILLFYPSGFSEPWRPTLEDVMANDWEKFPNAQDEPDPIRDANWGMGCGCWKCLQGQDVTWMVLCPTCGNKRCPRANDHKNECTNSNEPGQKGSSYE
ncbi:MAG TPA: hypothetical protein VFD27_03000 [Chthoniobacteraceae bacterium]|nr:hypothetical protein [Chthoniobacteraceae bacterium]